MRLSHTARLQLSPLTPSSLSVFSLSLFLLAFFTTPVRSDVSISLPLAGQTFKVFGSTVTVPLTWIESQATPKLTDITSYTFTLCTGPNSAIHALGTIAEGVSTDDLTDYKYSAVIDASEGADGSYYIQIYAVTKTGWTIHYTNRFTLEGMTGTYVPTVGSVTAAPDGQTSLSDGTNTGVASINSQSFSIYYTSQTGPTRFAPMQTQPGSTVTKNKASWTRRYPTSAVTYFTSVSTHLDHVSTITPGWSYTVSSGVNWASPAPFPSVNGFYAASARLTKTPTLGIPTAGVQVTQT